MTIRRTLQTAVVTVALCGAVAPMLSTSHAQNVPPGSTDRAPMTGTDGRDDRRMDWGWTGLLGLAGLAGLMGSRREQTVSRTASPTTAPVR